MKYKLMLLLVFWSASIFASKEVIKTITVSAETKTCDAGVMQKECLQIKWSKNQKNWEYFYDDIQRFEKKPGYEYRLKISETNQENPPADGSSKKYKLIKLISKKKINAKKVLRSFKE